MVNLNISSPLLVSGRTLCVMGNSFGISVVAPNHQWAGEQVDAAEAEIKRVLEMLSATDQNSPVYRINQSAGIAPVKVNEEIFSLIDRSLKISDLTQGAFDITLNTTDGSLWHNNAQITALPDAETARHTVRLVDYRNVLLDAKKSTVFLKEKGMRIDLGSIAKGYATDRAKYLLQIAGVSGGVVNAFGDMITWGTQPDNQPWTMETADPGSKSTLPGINISNMAISTSGGDEQCAVIGGKRYTRQVNPKTGLPLRSMKSVSILSPSAELAAAMRAPVKVMGVKLSLNLFNRLNQLVCIIVNDRKKVYTSKSFTMMMG